MLLGASLSVSFFTHLFHSFICLHMHLISSYYYNFLFELWSFYLSCRGKPSVCRECYLSDCIVPGRIMVWGYFSWVELSPLLSVKITLAFPDQFISRRDLNGLHIRIHRTYSKTLQCQNMVTQFPVLEPVNYWRLFILWWLCLPDYLCLKI